MSKTFVAQSYISLVHIWCFNQSSYLRHREDTSIATQERQISLTHEGGGGQFLRDRSWQGLEQNLGSIPLSVAVKGQSGIASHYSGEGT